MTKITSGTHAHLFIPSEVEGHDSILWRLKLIDHIGLYSGQKLLDVLSSVKSSGTKTPLVRDLVSLANSDSFVLDEYETTLVTVINWLYEAESMPEERFLKIDRKTRHMLQFIEDPESYIQMMRKLRSDFGKTLLKSEGVKIRAKIAFQEVVGVLAPDQIIPNLVRLSPTYLGCSAVQKWIRQQKAAALSPTSSTERIAARKALEKLSASIKGDYRAARTHRKYSYWRLGFIYADLSANIKGAREKLAECTLDKDFFNMYCDYHKIYVPYRVLMLDKKIAAKNLALEIMVDKGLIPETKAFKDFQPIINKIQKKHFDGEVLSIADELLPIIIDFMDLPSRHPEIVVAFDPYRILAKVPLNFIRPKH